MTHKKQFKHTGDKKRDEFFALWLKFLILSKLSKGKTL